MLSSAGFVGTGLFVSEMVRNRSMVLQHVDELENQVQLRQDAEQQLRSLIESSPAAIITIDSSGNVLLANEAAHDLLAPGDALLQGQLVSRFLPALQTALTTQPLRTFRTTLRCTGQRSDGEIFLAGVWFSTYGTMSGPRLAAIIVDLSEDLCAREDLRPGLSPKKHKNPDECSGTRNAQPERRWSCGLQEPLTHQRT